VTRGALHHHFRSRDELWIAALHEAMGRMDEQLAFPGIASLTHEQRVDLVLDRYWRVFGGPIFVAGLEIRRAGRLNPAIQAEIQREFLRVKETRNAAWADAFPDTGLPAARLAGVRQLMLDVLRGFALRRITEGPGAVTDEEIAMAKSIIASLLLARPAPAAESVDCPGPRLESPTAHP
jgi:AcrR family transcriptional regulator